MNKKEAINVITDRLKAYRAKPYDELENMIDSEPVTFNDFGPSGVEYQIQIMAIWDDIPNGNIRVIGNIDDGGIRAFFPVGEGFIKSPTGDFIDE